MKRAADQVEITKLLIGNLDPDWLGFGYDGYLGLSVGKKAHRRK
jgi:hypothetical protein